MASGMEHASLCSRPPQKVSPNETNKTLTDVFMSTDSLSHTEKAHTDTHTHFINYFSKGILAKPHTESIRPPSPDSGNSITHVGMTLAILLVS